MDDRIRGLVYGAIIGDIVGVSYKGKDNSEEYRTNYVDVDIQNGDWTSVTDRLTILMGAIAKSKDYINIFYLADRMYEWQAKGLTELPPKENRHIGMNLNFVLKQKDYLANPLKSSKNSYGKTGGDSATNDSIVCNSICGIAKEWHKNTILHTTITTYDSRCIASCLTQSFIINCIFWRKQINWRYIHPLCHRMIVAHKVRKQSNLIEYNNHWHIALNYKNFIHNYCREQARKGTACDDEDSHFLAFLKRLKIGNYNDNDNQSYSLLCMVLAIITAIDIQHELSNDRQPNEVYYRRRIQELASCGGDSTSNCAVVGSIIGVFIGYSDLPGDWLKKINNRSWLELKLCEFIKRIKES